MKRLLFFPLYVLLLLFVALNIGCDLGTSALNSAGATVGGSQDIGYARNIIEAGGIPEAEYIVAEGLYSEHDIPTPAGECQDRLCLALGYGYALAVDDSTENMFVHLGFSTNVNPQDFHRPHLQLALVIDKSGSMSNGSMDAVKDALRSLVTKLDEKDEVTLIDFNESAHVRMNPRAMNQEGKKELLKQIDRMEADGGTNIEAGIKSGYEKLAQFHVLEGTEKRLMLFTDAMPNVGATDQESFRGITERYANEGIGLTAFGVGVDFGQELVYHISRLRGGNFFFLQNQERIREIFNEEFDYLVTPIIYNLRVKIATPAGMELAEVYGLPDWKPGDKDAVLEIPTVFFSKNRGAIILRYKATIPTLYSVAPDQVIATGSIQFTDPEGKEVFTERELRHNGAVLSGGSRYFSHDGTRLGVALTNTYLALHLACRYYYEENSQEALAILQRGIEYATSENAELKDDGLATEIVLMEKLKQNISAVVG